MTEKTTRFNFPLLVLGQGQKEVTHNESIMAIDFMLHPVLQSTQLNSPPDRPAEGQSWLVGSPSAGPWARQEDKVAMWTAGGWRFIAPPEGFRAWVTDRGHWIRRTSEGWSSEIAFTPAADFVAPPSGGQIIDVEARAAIHQLIERLGQIGLLPLPGG